MELWVRRCLWVNFVSKLGHFKRLLSQHTSSRPSSFYRWIKWDLSRQTQVTSWGCSWRGLWDKSGIATVSHHASAEIWNSAKNLSCAHATRRRRVISSVNPCGTTCILRGREKKGTRSDSTSPRKGRQVWHRIFPVPTPREDELISSISDCEFAQWDEQALQRKVTRTHSAQKFLGRVKAYTAHWLSYGEERRRWSVMGDETEERLRYVWETERQRGDVRSNLEQNTVQKTQKSFLIVSALVKYKIWLLDAFNICFF